MLHMCGYSGGSMRHFDRIRRVGDAIDLRTSQAVTMAAELESLDARSEAPLICQASIGVWKWEIASDAARGDPSLNRMFGVPVDAGDRPLGDYLRAIDPQQLCRVSNEIRKVVTPVGGDRYEQEYRLLAGGQTRWVSVRGFVRRDAHGNAVELMGVVLDITRQKELDAERRRLLERAEGQARIFNTALSAIRRSGRTSSI